MRSAAKTYRNLVAFSPLQRKAKLSLLAISCLFCLPPDLSAKPSAAHHYVLQYAPLAQSLSVRTGIPASVILGIALIESGHGSSENCKMLNNHFGIKGTNYLPAKGINYHSRYRSYTSDEASYGHFCTVIKRKQYYPKLKNNSDYVLWLTNINKGYYSSAGMVWFNKIKLAIERHRLYRFDVPMQRLSCSPRMNWLHAGSS